MARLEILSQEIALLKERNARVERDKAWETSLTRKLSIAALTYAVVSSFFLVLGTARPFVDALIPTTGFLLSTLSLPLISRLWAERVFITKK